MSYHNISPNREKRGSRAGLTGNRFSENSAIIIGDKKIIRDFIINTNDIKAAGEVRSFTITGTRGAVFSLEVKNGSNYYNFQTNLFQTAETKLSNITLTSGTYTGQVKFPKVSAGAEYDLFLYCETNEDTIHAGYREVRFADDSIDINSSTGSKSNLVQKIIYQTLDVIMTLNSFSPNGTVTGTIGSQTITTSRNRSTGKIPFSFNFDVTSTRSLTVDRQPVDTDVLTFVTGAIGSEPVNISGEDIYPSVTHADKVVNGDFSSGATDITMDDDVVGIMSVGDRVTGNAVLDARTQATAVTVTVVGTAETLGVKVFRLSESIAINDDETLSFSNRRNHRWPISATAFDVGKITAGMRAIPGVYFASQPKVAEYLEQTTVLEGEIGEYKVDKVKVPALDTFSIKPIISRNGTTKVATATTGSSTTPINITFDKQALLSFAGQSVKIFSYGSSEIKHLTSYDVEFSDLAVSLKEIKTTTTAAVTNSTSVPIADRAGIMDAISGISGIGIDTTIVGTDTVNGAVSAASKIVMDANVANTMSVGDRVVGAGISELSTVTVTALNPDGDNVKEFSVSEAVTISDGVTLSFVNNNRTPKVVSGAGSVTGAGTVVLSAAQTLQNGVELTFPRASTTATITGNIKVNKVGNENITLSFDLEKLLTMH